jgi:hypothetical protein
MARTNSRKIARRTMKKKSPFPAIMIVLYMAGLSLAYVYLYMGNSKLRFDLEVKKSDVTETQNYLRNLEARVAMKTDKTIIVAKIKQFNMRLDKSLEGQVIDVLHFDTSSDLPPHKLRQGISDDPETLTRR